MSQQLVTQHVAVKTEYKKRYGTIAAKIGVQLPHRLGIAMPLAPPEYSTKTMRQAQGQGKAPFHFAQNPIDGSPYAAAVKPGTVVTLTVEDITRFPDEAEKAKWVCGSPLCAGKHWGSKKELLAAHPDNKQLTKQEEVHVYYALVEVPAVAEKKNDKGVVTVEGEPGMVKLLSDEE